MFLSVLFVVGPMYPKLSYFRETTRVSVIVGNPGSTGSHTVLAFPCFKWTDAGNQPFKTRSLFVMRVHQQLFAHYRSLQ